MDFSKNKKSNFLKVPIIILILIVSVTIGDIFFTVYNLPFVFKNIFKRDLSYSEIDFDIFKFKLELKNAVLKNSDKELIKVDDLSIDFAFFESIVNLKPVISSLNIINLDTFVISKDGNILFPEFLNIKKSGSNNISNISIREIKVANSSINIHDGKTSKSFITDIDIFLPKLDFDNTNFNAAPSISGKILNETFKITGITKSEKDKITNRFFIKLNNFDLGNLTFLIPEISGFKVKKGILDTDIKLDYVYYKNKKSELNLTGYLKVKHFNGIYKDDFELSDLSSEINISVLNLSKGLFVSDDIKVNNGNIHYFIHKNKIEKNTKLFSFNIANLSVKKSNLTISDQINFIDYKIDIENSILTIKDTSNITFQINSLLNGVTNVTGEGEIHILDKIYSINKLSITNFSFISNPFLVNKFSNLKTLNLDSFTGSFFYSKDNVNLSGISVISNLNYLITNDYMFKIGVCNIDMKNFDILKNEIYINSISLKDLFLPVTNNEQIKLNNLSLNKKDKPYFINLKQVKDERIVKINEEVNSANISGIYFSKKTNFNFEIEKVLIKPDINFEFDKKFFSGKFEMDLNNFEIIDNTETVFKAVKTSVKVDKFNYPKSKLDISKIEADIDYAKFETKADRIFYVFSLFDITAKDSNASANDVLSIDSMKLKVNKIVYVDKTLDKPFSLNINTVNCETTKFPSYVYPEGTIALTGFIGDSLMKINGKLSITKGYSGELSINALPLTLVNPFTEKYINYSINSGSGNIKTNYSISDNKIDLKLNLLLKSLRLVKYKPDNNINISSLIPKLENSQGIINLDIPVKGDLSKPDINVQKLFFDLFLDMLSNTVGKTKTPVAEPDEPNNEKTKDYKLDGSSIEFLFKNNSADFENESDFETVKFMKFFDFPNKLYIVELNFTNEEISLPNFKSLLDNRSEKIISILFEKFYVDKENIIIRKSDILEQEKAFALIKRAD